MTSQVLRLLPWSEYPGVGTSARPRPLTTALSPVQTIMSATMLRLASRRCLRPSPIVFAPTSTSRSSALRKRPLSASARHSADPWLLPNMPGHLEKTTSPPDAPAPEPLEMPSEIARADSHRRRRQQADGVVHFADSADGQWVRLYLY